MSRRIIAQTIAQQIGARAFCMMGTRIKLADGPDLIFDLRGSRLCNKVRVHLDATDTYTLRFIKTWGSQPPKTVAEESGVYADMLHAIIEKNTGLALSL